jgi:hypothetical protein
MLGDSSGWRYHLPLTTSRPAYARALAIWRGQPHKLAIISGAAYDDASKNLSRPLELSVLDVDELIRDNVPPQGPTPLQVYYPQLERAQ